VETVLANFDGIRSTEIVWWGQLVTSRLWAQQLSFEHLSGIAKTHTDRQ
jgi:hypothetical protein